MGEGRVDTVGVKVKRIKVLGVPVDVADPEMAVNAVEGFLENGQHNQIVFLSVRGLLQARRDPEFARCVREAALVLPVSLGIVRGGSFLGGGRLSLFNPFEFIIRTLSMLEKIKGAVYLLGSEKEILEMAEENLLGSFHGIRVVGRYFGYFPKELEGNIVTAIKKSAPHLILAGMGVAGKNKWVYRHKKEFNPGISLWAGNCFEIFSGREKQASKKLHAAGFGGLSEVWRKPWRIVAVFPYLYYFFLLVIYKIFKL
jgi:N-acetylglucosaminyldiphosphoundecaprenol N-acetyl-beta-D-mannosaminyltransferase